MIGIIAAQSIGEGWISYLEQILANGVEIPDDREPILEAPAICLEMRYGSEMDPILQKHANPRIISLYTEKMFSREIIPELNSTYGSRLFAYDGVDQVQWIIDRLNARWWAKSSVISLLKPNENMPRIPCLISVMATIRDDELRLDAVFRSQNAFNSYGNFLGLKKIHELIAEGTKRKIGTLRSIALAPHIYRSNVAAAQKLVSEMTIASGAPRTPNAPVIVTADN
jgi:thymidylate synthase